MGFLIVQEAWTVHHELYIDMASGLVSVPFSTACTFENTTFDADDEFVDRTVEQILQILHRLVTNLCRRMMDVLITFRTIPGKVNDLYLSS